MKLVRDKTGRFRQRPHYEPNELDFECENIITKFLRDRYGKVAFPISTDDLTVLIEQTTEDLDIYADLSSVGLDVEGVTYFAQDKKPFVKISKKLSETSNQNRLRTTLTHEYAHVKFHNFLWDEKIKEDKAVIAKNPDEGPICKREAIVNLKQVDWMEWQAGYISGALLMPLSVIKKLVSDFRERKNVIKIIEKQSSEGAELIEEVVAYFQVSQEAAKVRLLQLNLIS